MPRHNGYDGKYIDIRRFSAFSTDKHDNTATGDKASTDNNKILTFKYTTMSQQRKDFILEFNKEVSGKLTVC